MTDEKIYRASIHFHSTLNGGHVSVSTDFSDELDNVDDGIPAAYSQLQMITMLLRSVSDVHDVEPEVAAAIQNNFDNEEDRARYALSQITAADAIAMEVTR